MFTSSHPSALGQEADIAGGDAELVSVPGEQDDLLLVYAPRLSQSLNHLLKEIGLAK